MQTQETEQAIAKAFVEARRAGSRLAAYPGTGPTTLADAYRIQDTALSIDGREVVGWKVGRINAPLDAQLGANRLAGPIFSDALAEDGAAMPVFAEGFIAGEAEWLLHVAPGFVGPVPTNDAETKAIIDDIRIGIEIASSPYPGINTDGPCVTVSDYGNNAGLVLGARVEGWADLDLCAISITTQIDDAVVGEATAATMLDGPYGAVRFLLGNLMARGIDVSGGLWVSSGAVTGVHQAVVGQSVSASFGDLGTVSCTLTQAQPR